MATPTINYGGQDMPRKNPNLNPFLETAVIENAIAYLHAINFKGLHKENMDNIAQLCHLSDRSVVRKILRNNKLHPVDERVTKNTTIEINQETINKLDSSRKNFLGDFSNNIDNKNCIGLCMKMGYVSLAHYKINDNSIDFYPFIGVNEIMLNVFLNIIKQWVENTQKENISIKLSNKQLFYNGTESFLLENEKFEITNKENNTITLSKRKIWVPEDKELCLHS